MSSSTFKHLVVSGGANVGFAFFGVLKTLHEHNLFNMDDIQTIHATSVGTLLAFYLTLGYDMDIIRNYVIESPWNDVYEVNLSCVLRAIQDGGMFTRAELQKSVKSLLLGKDLSVDITLADFFAYNKKEIHFYMTEYSQLKLENVSYLTHPHWKLLDAIYASCCLPVLYIPFELDGHYYIDGAIIMNYPLQCCLDQGHDSDSILGICHTTKSDMKEEGIDTDTIPFTEHHPYKLLQYIFSIFTKIWSSFIKHQTSESEKKVPNQIKVYCSSHPLDIFLAFEKRDERIRLLESGVEMANRFIREKNLDHILNEFV